MTRVKICCISSEEEVRLAVHFGAHALGLVSNMPSGPGVIGEDLIARLTRQIPPGVDSFLLTSETEVDAILDQQQRLHPSVLQLVDAVHQQTRSRLRQALPGIRIVQVIHVQDETSIDEALEAAETAHALLLDSGNPGAGIKTLGGTGKTHNWTVSRQIVAQSPVPVFLAGGLNPSNVREAIDTVQPYGVDICSGVRTNGKLDAQKLAEFIQVVKEV